MSLQLTNPGVWFFTYSLVLPPLCCCCRPLLFSSGATGGKDEGKLMGLYSSTYLQPMLKKNSANTTPTFRFWGEVKLFSFPRFFFQITSSTARDLPSGRVGNSSWANRIRGGAGPRCVWCSLQSNSEEKSWDRGVWQRDFKAAIVIEQQGSSSGCCKGFTR